MSDSFVIPWAVARQAPLSMGFFRQEYWSGLPFPSPGILSFWPRDGPTSPALAGELELTTEAPQKPTHNNNKQIKKVAKYVNLCSSSVCRLRKQQENSFLPWSWEKSWRLVKSELRTSGLVAKETLIFPSEMWSVRMF